MPKPTNWNSDYDIVVQAGHENTPDSYTGGESEWGKEIEWTPIVAEEAVRVLTAAGVRAKKIDASIKAENTGWICKLAVFVHFDDPDDGSSGPAVGYPQGMGNEPAANEWKALYKRYWPFGDWNRDNFTSDLADYYGYRYTRTQDAEVCLELGDLSNRDQALWMKPRLVWLGKLLAHFLSRRSGLGGIPDPGPFVEASGRGAAKTPKTKKKPKAGRKAPKAKKVAPKAPTSVKPFHTEKGYAYYKDGSSSDRSKTSGLDGTEATFGDGTVVIEASETIEAYRSGNHGGPKPAWQRRVRKGNVTEIEQRGYTYMERALPGATLMEGHGGLGNGSDVYHEVSTRFGKTDDEDGGTGSEYYKVVQTCSDVWGCSVTKKINKKWFGENYGSNPARLTAMVEVYFPKTKRYAKVPLIDVGPGETAASGAKIDLSVALDGFLGTDGKADVEFRLPSVYLRMAFLRHDQRLARVPITLSRKFPRQTV